MFRSVGIYTFHMPYNLLSVRIIYAFVAVPNGLRLRQLAIGRDFIFKWNSCVSIYSNVFFCFFFCHPYIRQGELGLHTYRVWCSTTMHRLFQAHAEQNDVKGLFLELRRTIAHIDPYVVVSISSETYFSKKVLIIVVCLGWVIGAAVRWGGTRFPALSSRNPALGCAQKASADQLSPRRPVKQSPFTHYPQC